MRVYIINTDDLIVSREAPADAPDITTAILDGHQPTGLTATQLIERADLPMSWREQRRTLGFA